MLLQITVISVAFGAVLMTIGTAQPAGQIALCLGLSVLVAGTHIMRRYPELAPAIRGGKLAQFMRIE